MGHRCGQAGGQTPARLPSAQQVGPAWRLPKEPPQANPDEITQRPGCHVPTDVLVRQPDSVIVVNHRTGEHATFPLPADARHAMLAAFLFGDGNLLLAVWDLEDVARRTGLALDRSQR